MNPALIRCPSLRRVIGSHKCLPLCNNLAKRSVSVSRPLLQPAAAAVRTPACSIRVLASHARSPVLMCASRLLSHPTAHHTRCLIIQQGRGESRSEQQQQRHDRHAAPER